MRNVTRWSERASVETSVSFGVGVRCGVPWAFDSENAANINKSDPNANLLNPVVISVSLSVSSLLNINHGQRGSIRLSRAGRDLHFHSSQFGGASEFEARPEL